MIYFIMINEVSMYNTVNEMIVLSVIVVLRLFKKDQDSASYRNKKCS